MMTQYPRIIPCNSSITTSQPSKSRATGDYISGMLSSGVKINVIKIPSTDTGLNYPQYIGKNIADSKDKTFQINKPNDMFFSENIHSIVREGSNASTCTSGGYSRPSLLSDNSDSDDSIDGYHRNNKSLINDYRQDNEDTIDDYRWVSEDPMDGYHRNNENITDNDHQDDENSTDDYTRAKNSQKEYPLRKYPSTSLEIITENSVRRVCFTMPLETRFEIKSRQKTSTSTAVKDPAIKARRRQFARLIKQLETASPHYNLEISYSKNNKLISFDVMQKSNAPLPDAPALAEKNIKKKINHYTECLYSTSKKNDSKKGSISSELKSIAEQSGNNESRAKLKWSKHTGRLIITGDENEKNYLRKIRKEILQGEIEELQLITNADWMK